MAVRPARVPEEMPIVRQLFQEFADEFLIDLTFQNFQQELDNLPGYYSPPEGNIMLSLDGDEITGCVAFRCFAENICEMKRLYVKPEYRQRGHGRLLAKATLDEARNAGYKEMYLDAMATLPKTISLYKSLGFQEIPPYYCNPHPNVLYFGLQLKKENP